MALKRVGESPTWKIASWSRDEGKGLVSGVRILPFTREQAAIEDFVVGESVWVSLLPGPKESFSVAHVQPHLAHFVPPVGLDPATAPPLDDALSARAAEVLARVSLPFHGRTTQTAEALTLRGWELTTNEYGLAMVDVHVEGELKFLRPSWMGGSPGFFEVARLCTPIERAYVDSHASVGPDDLAVALVGRWGGDRGVSFVLCADVAWTPPSAWDMGATEKEAVRAFAERPYVGIRVEERDGEVQLVAIDDDGAERRICTLDRANAHGASMWADAVSEALRSVRQQDEQG